MECFIILPFIATAVVHHLDLEHSGELHAGAKGLAAVMNQDIYDRIGPGETRAFQSFFNKYQEKIPPSIQLTEIFADREGLLQGFAAVEETPEPISAIFPEFSPLQDDLTNLLKKGPYILSKGEFGFDSDEHGYYPSVQADVRSVMLWIRMVAVQKWLRGSPNEAISLLANIFHLGNSFIKSPGGQAPEFEIWKNGLAGMNLLTWNDPSPENNRLIAQSLAKIDEDQWISKGERIQQLRYYLEHMSPAEHRDGDELISVLNILSSMCDKSRTETSEVFVQAGMIPTGNASYGRMWGLARKWTTPPAMRKRAERIPDSFFETDPLLSAKTISKFPRLVYLSHRYDDEKFHISQNRWRVAFQNQAKALKAAYAARVWHDEHGTWPTVEQFAEFNPEHPSFDGYWRSEHGTWPEAEPFATMNPQSAPFEWHITSATEPLVKHFMSIHGIDDEYLLPDGWNRSYHIGYLEMRNDYSRMIGGYGYLSGIPIDPLMEKIDRLNEDESEHETTRAWRGGLLDAQRRRFHEGIEGATATASVLIPAPPKESQTRMAGSFWPGSYELKDVRTPPECDATVICPIPERGMTDKPPALIGDATEPQRIKMNWASGILKAFRPLVVSVTEVCPPPQLSGQAEYNGEVTFAMRILKDIKPRLAPSLPGESKWGDVQKWTDPAQGQPAVVVGLKFPKRSFWVTHPGPDGVSDGPGLVYDPSNGIKSAGDIVQLAGMEY